MEAQQIELESRIRPKPPVGTILTGSIVYTILNHFVTHYERSSGFPTLLPSGTVLLTPWSLLPWSLAWTPAWCIWCLDLRQKNWIQLLLMLSNSLKNLMWVLWYSFIGTIAKQLRCPTNANNMRLLCITQIWILGALSYLCQTVPTNISSVIEYCCQ